MSQKAAWIITCLAIIGASGLFVSHSTSFRTGTATELDRTFIERMIPHHEGAVQMALLALERSKRPEVLSLAEGVVDTQTSEIADMRQWYKEWFGREVPPSDHSMHDASMTGDMDRLATAPDFNREFLAQMIVHHQAAVRMARELLAGTTQEEMRVLGDHIVTAQQREIEMMLSWLKAWYDDTN